MPAISAPGRRIPEAQEFTGVCAEKLEPAGYSAPKQANRETKCEFPIIYQKAEHTEQMLLLNEKIF